LLAGLGNIAHVFAEFAPKLTSLGHVYAVVRRGYGVWSRPESGYDVSRLGEDVLSVLNTLRIETGAPSVIRSQARKIAWLRNSLSRARVAS
jgi:hypothetical protein